MPQVIPVEPSYDLKRIIRLLAQDIGKEVAHHIDTMYPDAVRATSRNLLRSVEGCCINQIEDMLQTTDEAQIMERLRRRKRHRRKMKALYKLGRSIPACSAQDVESSP